MLRISIDRPVTVFMSTLGVVVLGLLALRDLSVDFLPSVTIPRITVQTLLPGAPAENVEELVTSPIEAAVGTAPGVRRVSSVSRPGVSFIVVDFAWRTPMEMATIDLRERIDQARHLLPVGARRPVLVRADPSEEPIMTVLIWEAGLSGVGRRASGNGGIAGRLADVADVCRSSIKQRIEQLEGVAQIIIAGAPEEEIDVTVDLDKLRSAGLSVEDLVGSLRDANVNLPGGVVRRGSVRLPLRILGDLGGIDEIRRVTIQGKNPGRCVRIADVATVVKAFAERSGVVRFNGEEVLALYVKKESSANTIRVSSRVSETLDKLHAEYPGYRFAVIDDQAGFIQQSVDDVRGAIVLGGILSFLVLFFFLKNPLYPAVAGLTIPISILATIAVMYFLRMTLNVISLTGLAVGVGMLGDNAIIVMENITRLREQGIGTRDAVVGAVREINLAATASTLTNVAVFLPVVFVEGVAGKLFADMAVTMTIALLVSLVVAVSLVPAIVSRERWISKRSSTQPGFFLAGIAVPVHRALRRMADHVSGTSTRITDRYLSWGLEHQRLVLGSTSALFAGIFALVATIPGESAPEIRQRWFRADLALPMETPPDAAARFSAIVESRLKSFPDVEDVCAVMGVADNVFPWKTRSSTAGGGIVDVRVKDGADVGLVMERTREFLSEMQRESMGLEFSVHSRGTTFEQILRSGTSDIEVRICGPDQKIAAEVAHRFVTTIGDVRGLGNLRWGRQAGEPGYALAIDRDKAWRVGVTVRDAAHSVTLALQGVQATTLSDMERDLPVKVRLSGNRPATVEQLMERPVVRGDANIPVHALARWDRTRNDGEIRHENQQRVLVGEASVRGRPVQAVIAELQGVVDRLGLPPGTTIVFGGENEEVRQSLHSLTIILVLSILAVYMILAAEYESVILPFVILLTSPLALVGGIIAMVLTGGHFNVMSMVGIVIMVGAVDNDAVIAVDIIASLQRQGVPLFGAVREGLVRRLRPILMTTATTVLGVVPLLAESGSGSDLVRALTVPLVGGLISSTFFTLTVIPIVYAKLARWRRPKSSTDRTARQ